MRELRPKIVKYLAGELVARRMKPGMLVPFILGLLRVRESLSFVIWGGLPSENSVLGNQSNFYVFNHCLNNGNYALP